LIVFFNWSGLVFKTGQVWLVG